MQERRFGSYLLFIVILFAIGGIALKLLLPLKEKKAKLRITSTPKTLIFLDNTAVGETPFEGEVSQGEHVVKLVSEGEIKATWEKKINLAPLTLTYINQELANNDLERAGEIISVAKIKENVARLEVISEPAGAQIKINGEDKGTTPLILEVERGEYDVEVSSPGFFTRSVRVKTTPSYKVVVNFKLALSGEAPTPTPTPGAEGKPSEPEKPYVLILDTPTGWLRVREGPSTATKEITKVKPGEKYPLLDEEKGWFKIKLEDKEGWVSGKYAEKKE